MACHATCTAWRELGRGGAVRARKDEAHYSSLRYAHPKAGKYISLRQAGKNVAVGTRLRERTGLTLPEIEGVISRSRAASTVILASIECCR